MGKNNVVLGLFSGNMARFAMSSFGTLQRVGFDKATAHFVACDYAAQMNEAMNTKEAKGDKLKHKVGEANKDGFFSFKISMSFIGTKDNALALVRVAQTLEGLKAEKLLAEAKLDKNLLSESIQGYLSKVAERVEGSRFFEGLEELKSFEKAQQALATEQVPA